MTALKAEDDSGPESSFGSKKDADSTPLEPECLITI